MREVPQGHGDLRQTRSVERTPVADVAARRGARRPTDVPADLLLALAAGRPSVNHMEQMAMDAGALLATLEPSAAARADELRGPRFLDRLRAGADVVWDLHGEKLFDMAQNWESDTARGWAAFAVPRAPGGLEHQLQLALVFAEDPHFAVREWAWLGARPVVAANPSLAVDLLARSTGHVSPRVRRFCSEVTRPRGVWSAHIDAFKIRPECALPVLDPLAAAPERYVRDSVGNWLNDAARTAPRWVEDTCVRWRRQHGTAVDYVLRRGRRGFDEVDGLAARPV